MEESTTFEPSPPLKKEQSLFLKGFIILIKLLSYAIALLIVTLLFSGMMAAITPDLNLEDMQGGDLGDWKSMTLIYIGILGGTFLMTWVFRVGIDRRSFDTVGLKLEKVGVKLLKGAMWSIGLLSISFLILCLLGVISIVDFQFEPIELLGYLLLFLLAALVEELIFRGYMIPLIAKDFHFMAALLISSLAFAAAHIGNAHFTWIAFCNIFFGGYLMALFFLKYQDLYLPLGLHWIWNYFQGNILGFEVSGHEVESLVSIEMVGTDWLTGGEFGLEGSIVTTILLFGSVVWLTYQWYDDFDKPDNLDELDVD